MNRQPARSTPLLAGGAEDGGSGGDLGGAECGLAAVAGLAGAAVGVESGRELAGLIAHIAVIPKGCAAEFDGAEEKLADDGDEFVDLGGGDAADELKRMKLGLPEGLIDVDVAQAGDIVLGEEPLLKAAIPPPRGTPMGEVLRGEFEGVGAEVAGLGGKGFFEGGVIPDAAEAAGVVEADVGAVGQFEDEMGVFGDGSARRQAIDVAGHAEVEVEGLLVVGGEK